MSFLAEISASYRRERIANLVDRAALDGNNAATPPDRVQWIAARRCPIYQGYRRSILNGKLHLLQRADIDGQGYRQAMSRFAGHVHVVTTDGAAGRRGVTVIAACSVSDAPPTILVCLNHENEGNERFVSNGVFALNTLGQAHKPLADAFSGLGKLPQEERFAHGNWLTLATGAPVLQDAVAAFDCTIVETHRVATHTIMIGRVVGLRIGAAQSALLYHNRGYTTLP
jgi:cob(II)yrinic acid a,c-diamide reductase